MASGVATPLTPASDIRKDHHLPLQAPRIPMRWANSTPTQYYKNPWPSYRMPSMGDMYKAYQNGAAIALHPKNMKPPIETDEHDHDEDTEEEAHHLLRPPPLRDENGTLRGEPGYILPGVYIRPEFARIAEEDETDEDWREPPVDVKWPNWGDGKEDKENVTWLGHAGVLVRLPWKQLPGQGRREGMCGVLFDPIFSARCSPSQYVGPSRTVPPPCPVSVLPEIHLCLISHDHYDHLDYYTIMDLWKGHQRSIHFFVPIGLKAWFESCGIPTERITELDWWHESLISFPSPDSESYRYTSNEVDGTASLTLKVAFTPAQHRSGRGIMDHMTTLWGSWCVGVVAAADAAGERGMRDWQGFKMYFGGDTGYRYASAPEDDPYAICPAFQEIADHYAPFSFSLLPLSTGSSLPFLRSLLSLSLDQYTLTSSQHCSPADSMEIHKIIQSRRTLGMHWGTFCDTDEARGTRVEFGRARRSKGLEKEWGKENSFVISDIGETLVFPN